MKRFIPSATTTTTKLLCLFLFLALVKDRSIDAAAVEKEKDKEEYHRSLQVAPSLVHPQLDSDLSLLYQNYLHARNLDESNSSSQVVEYVSVDIAFTSILDNERAQEVLRPAVPAIDFISCFQYLCSTRVPVRALKDIASIDAVQVVHSAQAVLDVGLVTTEGDKAMFADVARPAFAVNGNGLFIGVLSDSYNCQGGEAADIASGDLPSASDILILREHCPGTDEGRAMMQIIHDVAPGARLAFRTTNLGQADYANGILELAAAGCDVMVDDIRYMTEPFFQDGVIAQAANQVVAQGIPYFCSAGNYGRSSWDAPTGFIPVTVGSNVLHQFGTDSSGNPITRMRLTLITIARKTVAFQWDQPFKSVTGNLGSQSNIDIYLYSNNVLIASSTSDNIAGGDPFELFTFNPTISNYELEIRKTAGPNPKYMKLVVFGGDNTFQFPTKLGTSFGHSNAALTAGVGAALYTKTPAFGVSPPQIDTFSSAGGIPIFMATDGTRLLNPEIRNQPRFTGPNGGITTFFGVGKRFIGTSAAAPHVAAVAALMLEFRGGRGSLTPAQIYSTLQATAIDMDDPFTPGFDVGFDFGTGHGLVNALAALQALVPVIPTPVASPVVPTPVEAPVVPTPVEAPVVPIPVETPVVPTPVTAPVVPTPVVVPVVPSPVVSPVVPTPVTAPVVPTPVEAPVVPTPVTAPVVPTPVEAPVVPTPVEAPVVPTPVTAPVVPTPVVPTPVDAPVVPTPVVPTPVTAPVVPTPVEAPVVSFPTPVEAPVVPTPVTAPVVPTPVEAPERTFGPSMVIPVTFPIFPTPVEAPVVPTPVTAPVVPTPVTAPVVPTPVTVPVVPTPVEAPIVPTPATSPVVPTPVTAPVVPTPVEAPAVPTPVEAPERTFGPSMVIPVTFPFFPTPIEVPVVPVTAPVVPTPVTAPVVPTPVEAPVVPTPVEAPVVPTPVTAPVVPTPMLAPVVPTPVLAPIVPTPVTSPVVPTPVTAPVVPTPVEVPVVPTPVTAPVVPTPVTSPVVPTPVTAPVIPTPVTAPTLDCTVAWKLFNSNTDVFVADLTNGVTIANPPPCGRANIEAVVPCATSLTQVTLDLFRGSRRIKRKTELEFPYFLYGNNGLNILNGKIPAGPYGIRALVNGVWSPFTNFTLGGSCS